MRDTADNRNLTGHFCPDCGQFFVDTARCPSCGWAVSPEGEDSLSIPVNLSIWICDTCRHVMSIGTPTCPKCGEPADGSESPDPRKGPVNRLKLKALGGYLEDIKQAASIPSDTEVSPINHTDEQFLAFLNRTDLLSERLIGDVKDALQRIDLSSSALIRSTSTRRGMQELLTGTEAIRDIYGDLAAIEVGGQLSGLHLLLLSACRALLDLRLACARAILVITLEECHQAQQALRETVDPLAVTAQLMAAEIDNVESDGLTDDEVNSRLGAFVGVARQYEHAGRPDLAAALSAGLDETDDLLELGKRGADYFERLLTVDISLLPRELAVTLFALAAETAALRDPMTVRRRANVLLGLYNGAHKANSLHMLTSLSEAERDAEKAASHMLSLGDRILTPRQTKLPIDAARQELADYYEKLSEWVYRPLLNLPLVAKSIVSGNPKQYADIALSDFGAKVNELSQTSDPRYAPVLMGVSTVARNAGAHGGVDTSGEEIVLSSTDREGRTKVEKISDEEFIDRLENLALTCRAILLAGALLRVQHHNDMPSPHPVTQRRVAIEHAQAIVGYFGLTQASVQFEDDGRVIVSTKENSGARDQSPRKHLVAALTLATLFPKSSEVVLKIFHEAAQHTRIAVRTADVVAHQAVPNHAKTYSMLRLCYTSRVEGVDSDEPSRLLREIVSPCARLLNQDLAELERYRNGLPKDRKRYIIRLRQLSDVVEMLTSWMSALQLEEPTDGAMRGFLVGVDAVARGLSNQTQQSQAGQWHHLKRPNKQLERGMKAIRKWSQPADGHDLGRR